ncbi:uncharacterized protein Tco025E_09973, partial [Trypanosoma conorhini]
PRIPIAPQLCNTPNFRCEETPGHLLPCAAGQSKFGLEGLEAPELDSSASNWLGSLAAGSASRALNRLPSVAKIRVDGVARPLGGGSALYFIVLLIFFSWFLILDFDLLRLLARGASYRTNRGL